MSKSCHEEVTQEAEKGTDLLRCEDVFLSVTQAAQKKKSDLNTRKLMTLWLLVQKCFTTEVVHMRLEGALVTKIG